MKDNNTISSAVCYVILRCCSYSGFIQSYSGVILDYPSAVASTTCPITHSPETEEVQENSNNILLRIQQYSEKETTH